MDTHQAISVNVTAIRFICAEKEKKRKGNGKTNKQGKYEIKYSISERPQAVEKRSELGHWEGDTVAGRKGGARFLTQVDRKSRFLLAVKVPNGTAEAVRDALIRMFSELPAEKLRSITPDRGHEFAKHSDVSDALRGIPFYFADPYSPWQRGTNENTNGLLRQYFPKETSFDDVSDAQLADVVDVPYLNGFTEGCNNKTKVLKRVCFGVRSFPTFRNRILHCAS